MTIKIPFVPNKECKLPNIDKKVLCEMYFGDW